ncbi:phosphomannomutase [Algibacillus agarilyticus]|uniref:phosphomannomutase n=1 Tax=Algibacillus agarilyticus TaxID=2234133 RepID=UPI0022B8536B|nr:phosphomannomutase [Algibacillus agarilyticus]
MLRTVDVLNNSGVAFGTSGARGLVTQFTPDVCAAFAFNFIEATKANYDFDTLIIGIDNRPSSYDMAKACAYAAQHSGLKVVYYGVLPTPALAYVALEDNVPAIMVTGSHIPFDRNGLKFYRPDGEISKADEQLIIGTDIEFSSSENLAELEVNPRGCERYIERFTSLYDSPWLAGKRIGIYEHSSAGRELYAKLFTDLGAEVVSLERSDEFVPIDTEAVSEADKAKARNWSKEYNFDAIFSTDGDGDRPLISDEKGEWLRGDILGLICAKQLQIEALAIPVSCNTAVEVSNAFSFVERTKIGSPYVIAAFEPLNKQYASIAGFEANGGFLLGSDVKVNDKPLSALPTRDALLPALMLLDAAMNSSISAIVNALPSRYTYSDRVQNFATATSKKIIAKASEAPLTLLNDLGFTNVEISSTDTTDGLRITLSDGLIVHLRPSGNAPELRCYAESDQLSTAKDAVTQALENITNIKVD